MGFFLPDVDTLPFVEWFSTNETTIDKVRKCQVLFHSHSQQLARGAWSTTNLTTPVSILSLSGRILHNGPPFSGVGFFNPVIRHETCVKSTCLHRHRSPITSAPNHVMHQIPYQTQAQCQRPLTFPLPHLLRSMQRRLLQKITSNQPTE